MENKGTLIKKTELRPKIKNMTIEELQEYLHKTAFFDEDKIALITFEKIIKKLNRLDEAVEELLKKCD